MIVPARTSGESGDEDGITLFAVDARASRHLAAQLSHGRWLSRRRNFAARTCASAADAVLGKSDEGFAALDAAIDDATLAVCAEAVGIMQVLKDKTVEYSKNREQFGVPIGSFQALQHRMVDMLTACEQAQSLLLWAAMSATADGDRLQARYQLDQVPGRQQQARSSAKKRCRSTAAWALPGISTSRTTSSA